MRKSILELLIKKHQSPKTLHCNLVYKTVIISQSHSNCPFNSHETSSYFGPDFVRKLKCHTGNRSYQEK